MATISKTLIYGKFQKNKSNSKILQQKPDFTFTSKELIILDMRKSNTYHSVDLIP